jgi:hypothetical protein
VLISLPYTTEAWNNNTTKRNDYEEGINNRWWEQNPRVNC